MSRWYLEGKLQGNRALSRIGVTSFPFRVGRQAGLELTLSSRKASRVHAELIERDGALYLRDLNSTNGCFINAARIHGVHPLLHGDIIHFGDCEFRLLEETVDRTRDGDDALSTVMFKRNIMSSFFPVGIRDLQEMLKIKAVSAVFQPIVRQDAASLYGYEVLGRGAYAGLSTSPGILFKIAESCELAVELSELFREHCLSKAVKSPAVHYFFNIHPEELTDYRRLLGSFERLRQTYPSIPLVLEVHEEAVSDLTWMRMVKEDLDTLKIEIAYDDFGAGQTRLLELVEAPPHYLKFDARLIRSIDSAPEPRIEMVRGLVDVAHQVGTLALAECVQTSGEVEMCRRLGFDLFQGFCIAQPSALPDYQR